MMGVMDFTQLPPDLPVPEDDGAADHLPGMSLPSVELPSTMPYDLSEGLLVAYVYPRTGVPGVPLPEGWDDIPGSRGCTPQSCAFPLLSDPGRRLAEALRLPTFEVDGMTLYKRLTFVAEDSRIVKVFYPVFPPDRNAEDVLDSLRD